MPPCRELRRSGSGQCPKPDPRVTLQNLEYPPPWRGSRDLSDQQSCATADAWSGCQARSGPVLRPWEWMLFHKADLERRPGKFASLSLAQRHLLLCFCSGGLCPDLLVWRKDELMLRWQLTINSVCTAR